MVGLDRNGGRTPKGADNRRSGQGQGGQRRPKRENDRGSPGGFNASPKEVTSTPNSRSSQAQRQNHHTAPSIVPDHEEVLGAVESLYLDELKPFGRILRKRIAERAVGGFIFSEGDAGLPDVDIKHLRNVCATSDLLTVVPEEGGDWSALIRGRDPHFVNVYSPQDLYEPELWEHAAEYFSNLSEDEMCLPGGRYSCAQALVARKLPFLINRSLGQVCHIVQLAISQKRLLGYFSGAVVPYSRSQSMVKEWCAYKGAPCTNSSPTATTNGTAAVLPLATWEEARDNLRAILESVRVGANPGVVPLSNVKRLFRSRYQVELSETMLGYSKLSELLQDTRMSDICTVQLQGHGYIVVQNPNSPTSSNRASANQIVGDPMLLRAALPSSSSGGQCSTPGSQATPLSPPSPARSISLSITTTGLSTQVPCRVEIGDESPLRKHKEAASRQFLEREKSPEVAYQDVSLSECYSPSISPYPRNRHYWPATPDRSPDRKVRLDSFGAYQNHGQSLGPVGGPPPSLANVHGLNGPPTLSNIHGGTPHGSQVTPMNMMGHSAGGTSVSSPDSWRADHKEEEDAEAEMRQELNPMPRRRPEGMNLMGASPAGAPSPGHQIGREEVRISSPKRRNNAASSTTESTTGDFSPARSPQRNSDGMPVSPSMLCDIEPMKIKVAPQTTDGANSPLGGGKVSKSLSPTRSKVRHEDHYENTPESPGLMSGLPGQPLGQSATTDQSRWAPWKPSDAAPLGYNAAAMAANFVQQTPPPLPRGSADLSPMKGATAMGCDASGANQQVIRLANLV